MDVLKQTVQSTSNTVSAIDIRLSLVEADEHADHVDGPGEDQSQTQPGEQSEDKESSEKVTDKPGEEPKKQGPPVEEDNGDQDTEAKVTSGVEELKQTTVGSEGSEQGR